MRFDIVISERFWVDSDALAESFPDEASEFDLDDPKELEDFVMEAVGESDMRGLKHDQDAEIEVMG